MKKNQLACLLLFPLLISLELMAQENVADLQVKIQELYVGILGRAADRPGLDYWADQINAGVFTLENTRAAFTDPAQTEYTEIYGGLDNTQLVTAIYENFLERAPDTPGLLYWVSELDTGRVNADQMINAVINAVQDPGASGAESVRDLAVLANKIAAAKYFTEQTKGNLFDAEFRAAARSAVADVTDDPDTLVASMALADGFEGQLLYAEVKGLIEEGILLLVDEQGNILNVASAFGREPDEDFNGDGFRDSYSFRFSSLPVNSIFSLYLITSGEIFAVFEDSNGDSVPDSNVFSIKESTIINLGIIRKEPGSEGALLTQFDLFSQSGVVTQPANPRIPIGVEQPPLEGLSAQELVQAGMGALFSGWIGGANAYFEQVFATTDPGSSPEADTARFFLAFSTMAALVSESPSDGDPNTLDRIGDVLDLLGIPDDVTRGSPLWMDLPKKLDQGVLSAERLAEFFDEKMRSNLDRAVELLEQVSAAFTTTWIRPDNDSPVENDYGDVQFFLGLLKLEQSFIATSDAYDLEVDINSLVENFSDDDPANDDTVESVLDKNPNFLSLANRSELTRARDLFLLGAVNNLEAAITTIEEETDLQGDDLIRLTSLDNDEIVRTRDYLANIRRSVELGETLIEADDGGDQSKDLILDLRRFFTEGVDFRADGLLPAVIGNDLDKSQPCLPDPTFNGVVISPDLDAAIYDKGTCD